MNNERQFNKKEILDQEIEKILNNNKYNNTFGQIKKWLKIKKKKLLIYCTTGFLIGIIFIISIAYLPPHYSKEETEKNKKIFYGMISRSGEAEASFIETMELLEQHPYFFKKVVNNINQINIKPTNTRITTMEIDRDYGNPFTMILHNTYTDKKKLGIRMEVLMREPSIVAPLLVHEATHAEYAHSGKIRQFGLFIKCHPLLNPYYSTITTDPLHRFSTYEICSSKEELKFNNAINRPDPLLNAGRDGYLRSFFRYISVLIKSILYKSTTYYNL